MVNVTCVFFWICLMTVFVIGTSVSDKSPGNEENIRFVFARTLCQDHLKSKYAKMIRKNIGNQLCSKPIYCTDPDRGVMKIKLPNNSRDGLICKLAYRAEGKIPYICRGVQCVEAPEYKDRLTVDFML